MDRHGDYRDTGSDVHTITDSHADQHTVTNIYADDFADSDCRDRRPGDYLTSADTDRTAQVNTTARTNATTGNDTRAVKVGIQTKKQRGQAVAIPSAVETGV
jgi:hypothetical protein